MQKITVIFWSCALIAIGLAIFIYKTVNLNFPFSDDENIEVWTIQAKLNFASDRRNVKAQLVYPNITPGYKKIKERFISGNFGLQTEIRDDNKLANWSLRKSSGQQTLYYLATITKTEASAEWLSKPDYPKAPEFPEPYATAVAKIIEDVRSQSADTASFAYELIDQLSSSDTNENIALIRDLAQTDEEHANLLIKLLSVAHIPTRKLWIIYLADATTHAEPKLLIQVYDGDNWITLNSRTGDKGIPPKSIAWKVGDGPLFTLENGRSPELQFSVKKSYMESLSVVRHSENNLKSLLSNLTLFSLPLHGQISFSLILMIPVGALFIIIMRCFVGVQTFGTFMPILIAVAFRETQLLLGVILFSAIVFFGLVVRFYLEKLHLLLIPRLVVILITVIILMLIISYSTSELRVERLLSVSLFPIVILAMTIERMSITWEENGAQAALLQGIGSLFVACCSYLLMTNEQLSYMMFVFPELLFVILGLSLFMGRYTGYRLTELVRFREIRSSNK